jgi:hypothetical protein
LALAANFVVEGRAGGLHFSGLTGAADLEETFKSLGGSPVNADVSAILSYLTDRQHVRPHAQVSEVLEETTDQLGCCPEAIARALAWLNLEPTKSIGRLRRSELMQLANAVHRFWRQNSATAV